MSNPGDMLRQAIEEMKLLSTAEEMADCFERWANQIKQAFSGWEFAREKSSDGGHIFFGQLKGQLLVISPDRHIYRGNMAFGATKLNIGSQITFDVDYNKLNRVF